MTEAVAALHPVARLPAEWAALLEEHGARRFHARQVFRWIRARGVLAPARMTDLSGALREKLAATTPDWSPLVVERTVRSEDGTRKLLMRLTDGAFVECVIIPMGHADDPEEGTDRSRWLTLCVSTQVGCAMGCVFCASGQAGLTRGLGAAEIVAQVLAARRELGSEEKLRNLVFMGMGEPLHHIDETLRALRLLTHPDGAGFSPRRITVSTVGLVPGIRRLGEEFGGQLGLAVSLHAPDDATRERLVPMNRRFGVAELMRALREYPLPQRRRITIEYTLIAGQNDADVQAHALVATLAGIRVKVNLIPMNPIAGSDLVGSAPARVEAFRSILAQHRVSCSVRARRGDDVAAACGQLALVPEPIESACSALARAR